MGFKSTVLNKSTAQRTMRITGTGFDIQGTPAPTQVSTERIVSTINQRESVFEKITKVRKEVIGLRDTATTAQQLDSVLCFPEQFQSRILRGIICSAKLLEELGEIVSDLSGSLERLCRNMLSGGNKQDIPQIFSAGVGRVAVSFLNLPGFAVHKAAGSGLYFLSCLLSATAVGLAKTQLGARRSPAEIEQALQTSTFSNCMAKQSARFLTAKKEELMQRLFWHCRAKHPEMTVAEHLAKRLSRKLSARGPETHQARRFHTSYMWKHLHQYGPITQTLMKAGQLVFHVVNKLGGSFDKYLGSVLGSKVFKPYIGRMLGHRVGMMICVGGALGLSFPLAPLIIGLSTASAIACGLAITLLLLAKASAYHEGWYGNIAKPNPA